MRPKKKEVLTLDCDSSGRKAALFELSPHGDIRLKALHLEDNLHSDTTTWLEAIFKEHGRSLPLIACWPQTPAFIRLVKLPEVDLSTLEKVIAFEAQQHVPFSLEEIVWDYQLMPSLYEQGIEALLVAMKTSTLEQACQELGKSSSQLLRVEPAPLALYNAYRFHQLPSEGSSLLIDIGQHTSHLLFMEKEHVYCRALHLESGQSHRLIQEIDRSIHFYQSHQKGSPPCQIILAGEGELSQLSSCLSQKFSIPHSLLNPLEKIIVDMASCPLSLEKRTPSLGRLVGMALRERGECPIEVDLLPLSLELHAFEKKQRPYLSGALLICLLFWGLLLTFEFQKIKVLTASTQLLENRLESLHPLTASFQKLLEKEKETDVYLDKAHQLLLQRNQWVEMLHELHAAIPEGMWITSLKPLPSSSFKEERQHHGLTPAHPVEALDIHGLFHSHPATVAHRPEIVGQFIQNLQHSSYFEATDRAILSVETTINPHQLASAFHLRLPLKTPSSPSS